MDGGGEMGRYPRKYRVDAKKKRDYTKLQEWWDDSGVSRGMLRGVRCGGGARCLLARGIGGAAAQVLE